MLEIEKRQQRKEELLKKLSVAGDYASIASVLLLGYIAYKVTI